MGLDIYFNTRKKGAEEESGYTNENSWGLLEKKFAAQQVVRELERENKINTPEYEKARKESEDAEKAYDEYEKLNPVQEVAYFRKANFLVSFFDYGEDCSDMEISKDDIVRLQETTKEILDKWRQEFPTLQSEDHTKGKGFSDLMSEYRPSDELMKFCKDTLPTEDGFFFGDTDYDYLYYDKVCDVYAACEKILAEVDFDNYELTLYCSW